MMNKVMMGSLMVITLRRKKVDVKRVRCEEVDDDGLGVIGVL